ncbi:peptidyl-prolyl cis-trans isomerase FKBP8 [Lepeophtheirus salmonis]|uniref:peptidyl-prolyl cis-trans isomerase FKBP8 n=1 Tax=Lepeophtheirus salmonis TaxID=72036 RepID=UPI001AE7667E|nr:peptidyl-prolyl cis-trans isomerase FKBP8-like [Lepeophtheirus salmonis]
MEERSPEVVEESPETPDPEGWEDILGTGRLKKRILSEGTPDTKPEPGDEVKVVISGTHLGVEVIPEETLTFRLAEFEAPKALDYILPIMNVNEVVEVITESDFMYGDQGLDSPPVPPKATLQLKLHLIDSVVPPPNLDLPLEERMALGARKKERGTFWYNRGEYQMAIFGYRKASQILDDAEIDIEVPIERHTLPLPLQLLIKERINALNNLAQAQMKNNSWESSLATLNQVLRLDPNNEKALFRKSKVFLQQGRESEAIGLLRRVTRLYTRNTVAKSELNKLLENRKKSRIHEERLSKKMLGLDKYEEELLKSRSRFFNRANLKSGLVYFGGFSVIVGITSFVVNQYVL